MSRFAAPPLLGILGLVVVGALAVLLFWPTSEPESRVAPLSAAPTGPTDRINPAVAEVTERQPEPDPAILQPRAPERVAEPSAADDPCGPAPTQAQGLSGTIATAGRGGSVAIAVVDERNREVARGSTDSGGNFRLGLSSLRDGTGYTRLRVQVAAQGSANLELGPFDVPAGTWQGIGRHVLMPAQGSLRIEIVQADPSPAWLLAEQRLAEPGAPLAGVEAELRIRVGAAYSVTRARTDSAGQAELGPLPKGTPQLVLEGAGFGRQALSLRGADRQRDFNGGRVTFIEDDNRYRIELFGDQRSRRVQVTDAAGVPISGVRLRGLLNTDAAQASSRELAVTGRDGVAWLPSGIAGELSITRTGYFPLEVDPAPLFDDADLRQTQTWVMRRDESIPLAPTYDVRGAGFSTASTEINSTNLNHAELTVTLRDGCGRPIPGARVQLARSDARSRPETWFTDAAGTATGRIAPGVWIAVATVPSGFSHLGTFQATERTIEPYSQPSWTLEATPPQ